MADKTKIGETTFVHAADFNGRILVSRHGGRAYIPMTDLLEFVGRFQKHESDLAMQKALDEERERTSLVPVNVMPLHMAPLTGLDQKPETD